MAWGSLSHERRRELLEAGRKRGRHQLAAMDTTGHRRTPMTVFDDFEPEDAWGPEDPVPEQVRNLRQRLALLVGSEDAWTDLTQELDLIENVLLIVRGRRSSARDALRADDLYTDIRLVRDRLG